MPDDTTMANEVAWQSDLADGIAQLKRQLRAAAGYARNLIEASLDPMLVVDLRGRIVDANRAAVEITGMCPNELAGKDLVDCFFQPEQAAAVLRRVFLEGQVHSCSLSIQH